MRVLVAAGGTGGHIFPAIAVAERLRGRGAEVVFAGSPRGIGARVVREAGFPFVPLRLRGFPRYPSMLWLSFPFFLLLGSFDAARAVVRTRPDVAVGFGGYASGPPLVFARMAGIPVLVHEQNSVPGFTTRVLSKIARVVCASDEEGREALGRRALLTGNPVRREIAAIVPPGLRAGEGVSVLVLGGSQGATAITGAACEMLDRLASSERRLVRVTLQVGAGGKDATASRLQNEDARVVEFIDDMAAAYRESDLVVCRAGALTLAEIACAGLPAILVPLPLAAADHQRRNARRVEAAGAALVIEQAELSGERLREEVLRLSRDRALRGRMAAAMAGLARRDAAERVADLVEGLSA
jgi:UDP-N-acetylglucosamine--N-acetylmuramyl-(pentapeptide) pyrophosphoryl-undecaprenol N-acetylglucosamine transferase